MSLNSQVDVVRPVGTLAKFNTARHSLGIMRAVIVTGRYNVSSAHLQQQAPSISLPSAIENAVSRVVLGQAMLRVGIAGEDTKDPAFVRLKAIDMRSVIEWKKLGMSQRTPRIQHEEEAAYTDDLMCSFEQAHQSLWEGLTQKPGWKVVVHHDSQVPLGPVQRNDMSTSMSLDISFCFHHAYADGGSGYIFHADLQRALNDPLPSPSELQNHILHLPNPPEIPPPMENLIHFSLSWRYILRTIWAEIVYPNLIPSFIKTLFGDEQPDVPWTGAPIDPSHARGHIRLIEIAAGNRIESLLALCRAHGVTLTALLHALIALSLAHRLPHPRSLKSSTPISLAKYADAKVAGTTFTAGKTMYCLNTALTTEHVSSCCRILQTWVLLFIVVPCLINSGDMTDTEASWLLQDIYTVRSLQTQEPDTEIWIFAKDMVARIRARAATLPRDDIQGLSGLVGDWHEFLGKDFGKARDLTWELSNLGSLSARDAGTEEGWFLDRAIFTQGVLASGPAFSVNVSGVSRHGICATVTWQDGIVDDGLMEGLVNDLRSWLLRLSDTGHLDKL
ncbi:hypothetical protein GGR57DRAFT_504416 [Xylariaceae sp. FL1272]|nr:hypothetical protein GGR57DRAFT_504416 [Xylariaceae sp. FL1272]